MLFTVLKCVIQDPRMPDDVSLTPLLWSDLSNISIGGLLSEASLQGRFINQDSKPGGSRLTCQPAAVVSDSLDAFINQITWPQATSALTPDMPSSILDAEDTCHSFAVLKPSPSSGNDFLTLGRRAFSELSNQSVDPRPVKCPKSEVCLVSYGILNYVLFHSCSLKVTDIWG